MPPDAQAEVSRARSWLDTINPPVFFISGAAVVLFAAFGVLFTDAARALFAAQVRLSTESFGWFYILSVGFFLFFAVWLMLSRHGHIRLGDDGAAPEFSTGAWFAMLFSAGMGIGLLFYGVAEPISHFTRPPTGPPGTVAAARTAMTFTYFHWGLHAWAIYGIMGTALAYAAYRRKLPLTVRSLLHPLLGERIFGPIGHLVDVLAVFGTLFGLATSLGLGAMQVNSGLHHLFGIERSTTAQIVVIAVITGAATVSLVSGLDRGIRRLSQLNIGLALSLLAFVFVAGPTLFLLRLYADNIGQYLQTLVRNTFWAAPYEGHEWQAQWTLFYWAWWIAWAPFVGTFIARISRGRTIRELLFGVMCVPSLVTFFWMTVFGGTALHIELHGAGGLSAAVERNVDTAIYELLARLPLGSIASFVAVVVLVFFFVTSSDSASMVVDMLTSGGHPNPPIWQRIFWASAEGLIAIVLLLAGGLTALQSATVATGLPFCVVLLLGCYCLVRSLQSEPAPAS